MKQNLLTITLLLFTFTGFGQCPNIPITLSSQADVDNFATNYPNCTQLAQSLTIQGNDISDLNPLLVITSLGDGLVIINNTVLESLEGLENINELTKVEIRGNDGLEDITAIKDVEINVIPGFMALEVENNNILSLCSIDAFCTYLSAGGQASIFGNELGACDTVARVENNCGECPSGDVFLSSQADVNAFGSIYPDCEIISGYLYISGDTNDLSPLANLTTVGTLSVFNTTELQSLQGLNNLEFHVDNLQLSIANNMLLNDISAISNMQNLNGIDLLIQNNPMLTNLQGLNSLQGFLFNIFIFDNENLQTLDGLDNITSFEDLIISGNLSLQSVSGFSTLQDIQSLVIINNDALTAIDFPTEVGFLSETFGELTITGNSLLTDIDSFETTGLFSSVTIENNPNLSFCSVDRICNTINANDPLISISISNNENGCNLISEVEANCGTFTDVTNFITGAWDNGIPDINTLAVIKEHYNTGTRGSIEANRLLIENGAILTVAAGTYLNIDSSIIVNGDLNVEHQGSVVQQNELATTFNNNSIEVHLTTPDLASRDFMVLGSPMTTSERTGVWNNAFLVLNHDTSNFLPHPDVTAQFPDAENFADDNGDFWNAYTGTVNVGEGYIVRPQTGYGQPGGIFNYTYNSGTLSNGTVMRPVIYNTPGPTAAENKIASPNIVANPYASAIWANDFINANPTVDEIYFWEHNTPPSPDLPGAGNMSFSMQDISMYNLSGGMAAASGGTQPNGYIATGQGFAFKANATGTVEFNNAMRRTDNNNTLRTNDIFDRVWLKLNSREYNVGSVTLLAFGKNTTSGVDAGFDSRRLGTVVSIFSQIEGETFGFGIQTREQLFSGMSINLGFSTIIEKSAGYEISIENFEGAALENMTIYLLDTQLNKMVNLKEEVYVFVSNSGAFKDRFVLYFETETLETSEFNLSDTIIIFPNPVSETLTISTTSNINFTKAEIYSINGQKLVETSATQINFSEFSSGVYFINVISERGIVTKKIVKQ